MKANAIIAKSVLWAAIALALQACASNTQRELPSVSLPQQFHAQVAAPIDAQAHAWWTALGDPALSDLIAHATTNNLDIAAASARIKAARAAMGVARSQSMPNLNFGLRVNRERISSNGLLGNAPGDAFPETYTLYRTGLDASWELDLFGAQAAERRKAQASHVNTVADLYAVRLSLAAEVSRVYIEHVVLAQQLLSTQHVASLREQTLQLITQQYTAGQVAEAEVARARLELDRVKTQLPQLQAEVAVRGQAMGALLGTGDYVALPDSSPLLGEPLQSVVADLSVQPGLPADLLRRRPDIRKAEAQFNAAIASRDIAVADQYPHIALTSSIGLESLQRGSLFEAASKYWSIVPQISLPLFDGTRRKSVVAQRKAEVEAATAEYRKAVVDALTDVEQALLQHRGASDALLASVDATQHASELLKHEQARYNEGATSLTQLLEAQRQFETQLQSSLDAKQQALLSFVSLHKSLGGEFDEQGRQAIAGTWALVPTEQLAKAE